MLMNLKYGMNILKNYYLIIALLYNLLPVMLGILFLKFINFLNKYFFTNIRPYPALLYKRGTW